MIGVRYYWNIYIIKYFDAQYTIVAIFFFTNWQFSLLNYCCVESLIKSFSYPNNKLASRILNGLINI